MLRVHGKFSNCRSFSLKGLLRTRGAAFQQPDALPTKTRRTLLSHPHPLSHADTFLFNTFISFRNKRHDISPFFWVRCGSPLQTIRDVLRTFNLKKNAFQLAITICSGLPHPTRSSSRIACRRQKGPRGNKDALWPVSRPILEL